MSIRSMIIALVVGFLMVGCVDEGGVGEASSADDPTGTEVQYSSTHTQCKQTGLINVIVTCTGPLVVVELEPVVKLTNIQIKNLGIFINDLVDVDINVIKTKITAYLALVGILVKKLTVCNKAKTLCV